MFSSLDHFPQVFGHAKEWSILVFHVMIRVSHVVVSPNVFILLCDLSGHGRVLKLLKSGHF